VRQDSRVVRQDSRVVRQDSRVVRQDSRVVRQDSESCDRTHESCDRTLSRATGLTSPSKFDTFLQTEKTSNTTRRNITHRKIHVRNELRARRSVIGKPPRRGSCIF